VSAAVENKGVGVLLRDLANDVTRLVRDEITLARLETQTKAQQAITALILIVGGMLMGFAALLVLLDALVYGLAHHMPAWLAAVIVGGVVAVVGVILVYRGKNDLSATGLMPERTAENVRRDINLVKEQVS
jgi:cytochrome c biogenesis protein CcdA